MRVDGRTGFSWTGIDEKGLDTEVMKLVTAYLSSASKIDHSFACVRDYEFMVEVNETTSR